MCTDLAETSRSSIIAAHMRVLRSFSSTDACSSSPSQSPNEVLGMDTRNVREHWNHPWMQRIERKLYQHREGLPRFDILTFSLFRRFDAPDHSYRSASMGCTMAALKAGIMPKVTPTPAENPIASMTAHAGTVMGTIEGCKDAT